ncbi:hypothetical protein CNMCM5623_000776 [Aspergillus felis]|uniref:Uncharacterized protein n=1 Tax=Aspergillus felis TaxID=1287682 RepID=A0A8H6QPD3_9EURO|nr:hypothetical protein CNMCM5623_000776 [Aspergillus felis]KAF7175847.1 hypothetical protein CNMCM7691_000379 [Aspergillus felis]
MSNPTLGGVNWVAYLTTAENASLVLSYHLAVGGAITGGSLVGSTADDLVGQVRTFGANYSSKPASAPWTSEDAVFAFRIRINDGHLQLRGTQIPLYQCSFDKPDAPFINQGDWQLNSAAYLAVYNQQLAAMVERFKSSNWWNDYHPGTKCHQLQAEDMKASLARLGAW